MAKSTSSQAAPADPREARKALDAAVAQAQRDALPAARPETQAQRDARIDRDREAAKARALEVEEAQLTEAHAHRRELEALTPAEWAERAEAGRRAVLDRQAAVDAAVAAEGRRLAGLE